MTDDTTTDSAIGSDHERMHRFLFDETDLRGEVVSLAASYGEVLAHHDQFPAAVQTLLGEFLAAVSLMSGRVKFDGIMTLQATGDGPLPLIMAECSNNKDLRAVARLSDDADLESMAAMTLPQLLGKGLLAIIVEPQQGMRYQGVVPLDADNLAGCLDHYFQQSEQLKTRFWLKADSLQKRAAGLMLQAMPQQTADVEKNDEAWDAAEAYVATASADELFNLDHHTLLFRLFHELKVHMYPPSTLQFFCRCSRQASERALVAIGRKEVETLLEDQEQIVIDCQFCNQQYRFVQADVDAMFGGDQAVIH